MEARLVELARLLRVLGDAFVDAARRGVHVDALAVVNLTCDACRAWMTGTEGPIGAGFGPDDAALARHVAAFVARQPR